MWPIFRFLRPYFRRKTTPLTGTVAIKKSMKWSAAYAAVAFVLFNFITIKAINRQNENARLKYNIPEGQSAAPFLARTESGRYIKIKGFKIEEDTYLDKEKYTNPLTKAEQYRVDREKERAKNTM